jgi:type IV pilus assembly protein PilA
MKLKKRNKKGFTLAELLIVVAIIAVLVAIAIPIFTSQLEKSRESTDLANVRSAYAEMMTQYLTWDGTSTIDDIEVPAQQNQANWQSDGDKYTTTIAEGVEGQGISVPANTDKYTVTIDTATGAITVS